MLGSVDPAYRQAGRLNEKHSMLAAENKFEMGSSIGNKRATSRRSTVW